MIKRNIEGWGPGCGRFEGWRCGLGLVGGLDIYRLHTDTHFQLITWPIYEDVQLTSSWKIKNQIQHHDQRQI